MISFSTSKLGKKICFGPIYKKLFSLSTTPTEKNPWKKLVELFDEFVYKALDFENLFTYQRKCILR
jgi:hypothetical protein